MTREPILGHIAMRFVGFALAAAFVPLYFQAQDVLVLDGGWRILPAGAEPGASGRMSIMLMLIVAALGGASNYAARNYQGPDLGKIVALLAVVQGLFWAVVALFGVFYLLLGALNLANGGSLWFWALMAGPVLYAVPGFIQHD